MIYIFTKLITCKHFKLHVKIHSNLRIIQGWKWGELVLEITLSIRHDYKYCFEYFSQRFLLYVYLNAKQGNDNSYSQLKTSWPQYANSWNEFQITKHICKSHVYLVTLLPPPPKKKNGRKTLGRGHRANSYTWIGRAIRNFSNDLPGTFRCFQETKGTKVWKIWEKTASQSLE